MEKFVLQGHAETIIFPFAGHLNDNRVVCWLHATNISRMSSIYCAWANTYVYDFSLVPFTWQATKNYHSVKEKVIDVLRCGIALFYSFTHTTPDVNVLQALTKATTMLLWLSEFVIFENISRPIKGFMVFEKIKKRKDWNSSFMMNLIVNMKVYVWGIY